MEARSYIVQVPLTLWIQVEATDKRLAHFHGVQAYEWMCETLAALIAGDARNGISTDDPPFTLDTFRVEANFERAVQFRGNLDIQAGEQSGFSEDIPSTL